MASNSGSRLGPLFRLGVLGAIGAAGYVYFFDPERGALRRSQAAERLKDVAQNLAEAAQRAATAAGPHALDVGQRVQEMVASRYEEQDDHTPVWTEPAVDPMYEGPRLR